MSAQRSKQLSYLLRHKPEQANLTLDKEGWCDLRQLLGNTDFTLSELEQIVDSDSKGRYSFQTNASGMPTHIRANQGHSTKTVDIAFKEMVPPSVLYHGTYVDAVQSIVKGGLKAMNRHHVHLSAAKETAQQVGSRRGKAVILVVQTARMHADGFKFYVSDNGVWLTDAVPVEYIDFPK